MCDLQEAVKSPSARVDNCATAVAMSASHSASFRPAAAVPFKPATASFKPAVAPSMQTKAAAVGPNRPVPAPSKPTVVGPSEQQSRANWAVTPAQVPLQQAQSGSKPLPSPVRPALPFKPALVPSQHETRPVLRPASVPFSPATVASQQTEVPSSSTALPLQPTAVPSLPATSSFAPVPFKTAKVPFRPAAVPFKAATLPVEPARVAAMGPSKTARSGVPSSSKAGLPIASPTPTASLPIASPPPKAGLPIASPSRKAGLPAASPTPKANLPIASLAPKAADAIITPAPSRAPVAAGLLSSPDSFAQPASQPSVMSEQQQPDAHTLTGPSTTAVAADTVALQTHDTTDQRCSRQADITQAVAGSVSNIAAVVDSSQKVSAHSANRKFPRARNQIVRAVKACAQAVSEPIAEGLGVSAHAQGLFKLVAEGQGVMDVSPGEMSAATASRRFPRARNMVVNAVKARALSLQASQGVRLGQTLAAASAAAGSSHVSKAASSPVPRLDLTQVCARAAAMHSRIATPFILRLLLLLMSCEICLPANGAV